MQSLRLLPSAAETALSADVTDHQLRCAYYCEENVWRLAFRKLHQPQGNEDYFVAFISNLRNRVPMFHQRASPSPTDTPCFWDYHVILIGVSKESIVRHDAVVYDVDTTLPAYPTPLLDYLNATFSKELPWFYAPHFRLISAGTFLHYFASDRSHMFNPKTHEWNAPPPSYRCILSECDDVNGPETPQTNATSGGEESPNDEYEVQQSPIVTPASSPRSNLVHYLNFGKAPEERIPNLPAAALGTILTLDELRAYTFLK